MSAANDNQEIERLIADHMEGGIIDEEEWFLLNELLDNNEQQERQQRGRNGIIPHQNYPAFNSFVHLQVPYFNVNHPT